MDKTSFNVKIFEWDYLHLTARTKETYFSLALLLSPYSLFSSFACHIFKEASPCQNCHLLLHKLCHLLENWKRLFAARNTETEWGWIICTITIINTTCLFVCLLYWRTESSKRDITFSSRLLFIKTYISCCINFVIFWKILQLGPLKLKGLDQFISSVSISCTK